MHAHRKSPIGSGQMTVQWLATLTAVPLGLGAYPGEGMDICKCIVPFRHGGTLNSRRAVSPLRWLVEERWKVHIQPQGFLPLNWGGIEQNRTVICMVLKAKAIDRRKNSST
ncbi:cullin-4A [Trichonephila clavipes]|nr:cullin-4A [Trichonephila clavipes]